VAASLELLHHALVRQLRSHDEHRDRGFDGWRPLLLGLCAERAHAHDAFAEQLQDAFPALQPRQASVAADGRRRLATVAKAVVGAAGEQHHTDLALPDRLHPAAAKHGELVQPDVLEVEDLAGTHDVVAVHVLPTDVRRQNVGALVGSLGLPVALQQSPQAAVLQAAHEAPQSGRGQPCPASQRVPLARLANHGG